MSSLRVTSLGGRTAGTSPTLPDGAVVTGVTTSTSFSGSLTGNATSATNAQGLTGTPDIAVRNITGVAATFTGVLTYEDVTNIDSIGIITARSDISIADKIVHTGDTNTAIRFPANDTFSVETGGTARLQIDSTGNTKASGTVWGGTIDGGVTATTSFASRLYNNSAFPTLYAKNSGNGGLWQGVNSSGTQTSKINSDGSSEFTTVSDSIGPLRRLGVNAQGGAYAFVVGDAGKIIRSAGSGAALTLNQNIFTAGDMISVFNVGSGTNTIVSGTGVTLYNTADGATTSPKTIAAKGMVTIVCTASNEFAISGTQLT